MSLQHKRSSIAHKRPVATSLNDGQLALNLNATSPGVFFKNSSNVLTKVGPVHVGTDAPNASPATGGSSGNSIGEQWLDTTGGTYVLKIWDGTAWRSESGTFVDVSGDTMTGALILPSGTEAAPALGVGTSDNGLYLPATDELGVSTNGSERLRIASDGDVGIGTTSPDGTLHVHTATAGSVSANASADNLIVENSGAGGISILTPNASAGGLFFGSPGDNIGAALRWNHDNDQFQIGPDKSGAHLRLNSGDGVEAMRIDSSGQVGIGTSSPGRTLDVNGVIRSSGTSAALAFGGNSSTPAEGVAIHRPASDQMAFVTNNTERMRIDNEGKTTIQGSGTSNNPFEIFTLKNTETSSSGQSIQINLETNRNNQQGVSKIKSIASDNSGTAILQFNSSQYRIKNQADTSTYATIDSSGRLLLGTTTEGQASADNFTIADSGHCGITIRSGTTSEGAIYFSDGTSGDAEYRGQVFYDHDGDYMRFSTAASEHMRIDSDGRLLVGETSASGAGRLVVSGNTVNGEDSIVTIDRGSATTSSGQTLGRINFTNGGDDVVHAAILCQTDAACGSNDNPGRILLSTTADGASSPTERMRIKENGDVSCGAAAHLDGFSISSSSATGSRFASSGTAVHFASGTSALVLSRQTNDGIIVSLRQAGSEEGSITVSGSTVSYNGGHLSRWSQLAGGAERTEILRGSVLSNLDEMCEWGEEDNEQLNRMKVSDVEGDRNVSGVFQDWDDDDDTYTNDFYCAMTGDFIIRIAQGTTVARGDLLMSAGDGTAKPQDDDIVRSKTIAKVTSTTVSTTYTDGSYCVPCVLMAC